MIPSKKRMSHLFHGACPTSTAKRPGKRTDAIKVPGTPRCHRPETPLRDRPQHLRTAVWTGDTRDARPFCSRPSSTTSSNATIRHHQPRRMGTSRPVEHPGRHFQPPVRGRAAQRAAEDDAISLLDRGVNRHPHPKPWMTGAPSKPPSRPSAVASDSATKSAREQGCVHTCRSTADVRHGSMSISISS
jgi:hypothetical protein